MIQLERSRDAEDIVPSFRGEKPVERLTTLMEKRREKLRAGLDSKLKIDSKWSTTKRQNRNLDTHCYSIGYLI